MSVNPECFAAFLIPQVAVLLASYKTGGVKSGPWGGQIKTVRELAGVPVLLHFEMAVLISWLIWRGKEGWCNSCVD